jgi:hypothetical protein
MARIPARFEPLSQSLHRRVLRLAEAGVDALLDGREGLSCVFYPVKGRRRLSGPARPLARALRWGLIKGRHYEKICDWAHHAGDSLTAPLTGGRGESQDTLSLGALVLLMVVPHLPDEDKKTAPFQPPRHFLSEQWFPPPSRTSRKGLVLPGDKAAFIGLVLKGLSPASRQTVLDQTLARVRMPSLCFVEMLLQEGARFDVADAVSLNALLRRLTRMGWSDDEAIWQVLSPTHVPWDVWVKDEKGIPMPLAHLVLQNVQNRTLSLRRPMMGAFLRAGMPIHTTVSIEGREGEFTLLQWVCLLLPIALWGEGPAILEAWIRELIAAGASPLDTTPSNPVPPLLLLEEELAQCVAPAKSWNNQLMTVGFSHDLRDFDGVREYLATLMEAIRLGEVLPKALEPGRTSRL